MPDIDQIYLCFASNIKPTQQQAEYWLAFPLFTLIKWLTARHASLQGMQVYSGYINSEFLSPEIICVYKLLK